MADTIENIIIAIQSLGADRVIADLKATGVSGQDAGKLITQALLGASTSTQDLTNKTIILTDAILNGEKNIVAYAEELQAFTAEEVAATAAAIKMGAAEAQAAEQIATATAAAAAGTTSLAEYNTKLAASSTSLSGFKGILATVGGFLAIGEIKSASDEYITLSNRIKQVTSSQTEFNSVLASLSATANASQADIGKVTQLYYNFAQSTKDLKPTQDQLLQAVDAVSLGLYNNGIQGSTASRIIKDFSEVITGAGNSSRLFNSIQQQAPGFLRDLAVAMDKTIPELEKGGTSTAKLTKAATDYTGTLESQKTKIDTLQTSLAKNTTATESGGNSLTKLTTLSKQHSQIVDQLAVANHNYEDTQIKANAAVAALAPAMAKASPKDFLDALVKMDVQEKNTAATMQGSFGGALTVLHNNFVLLVGSTVTATGALGVIRTVILTIADNLNIIIPLVATFIAGWSLTKVVSGINLMVDAIKAIGAAELAAGTAFELSFGLWVVIIAAVVIAIGYVLNQMGLLQPILQTVGAVSQVLWDRFVQGAKNAWQTVQDFWTWLSTNDFTVWMITSLNNMWTNWLNGWTVIGQGWNNLVATIEGGTLFQYLKSLVDLLNGVSAGTAQLETQTRNSVNSIDTSSVPGYATGGAFTIPGAGPTDSVPVHFMATPGEVVTIKTPAQAHNDNVPHFAGGGAISVGNSLQDTLVSYVGSSNSSVTGYATPTSTTAAATSSASTGTSTSTTSTPGQDYQTASTIAGSLSIYSTAPLLYGRSIDALSYIKGSTSGGTPSTSSVFIPKDAAGPLSKGISVTSVYRGYTADDIENGPLFSVAQGTAQTKYNNDALWYQQSLKSLNPFVSFVGGRNAATQMLADDVSAGAIPWNSYVMQQTANSNNNFVPTLQLGSLKGAAGIGAPTTGSGNGFANGGAFVVHAANGLDYTVPGGGPTDSRYLPLAVSPGENVSVKTPTQQRDAARAAGAGGNTYNFSTTIHAKDANDVRKSAGQLEQETATRYVRATRRSGA